MVRSSEVSIFSLRTAGQSNLLFSVFVWHGISPCFWDLSTALQFLLCETDATLFYQLSEVAWAGVFRVCRGHVVGGQHVHLPCR